MAHSMKTAKDILSAQDYLAEKRRTMKYVTREFQDYGYRLAMRLGDVDHKALYIKLAKQYNRQILDRAASYADDYPNAKNKGRIFMWKLSELKKEMKDSAPKDTQTAMPI
jgi:hypothetical protein